MENIWYLFGISFCHLFCCIFTGYFCRFVRKLSDSAFGNYIICKQLSKIQKEYESLDGEFDSQKSYELVIKSESSKSTDITEPEHEYTGCLRFIMSCFFCHVPKERYNHSFLNSLITGNCFHGIKGIYFENGFSVWIPFVTILRFQAGQMVSIMFC